jgi:hypothetical protein
VPILPISAMWQKDEVTLPPSQQPHESAGTPFGVAAEPAPAHSTVPVAVIATLAPAASVTPVSTHALAATLTVKLAVDVAKQPDVPQHFWLDVQQS